MSRGIDFRELSQFNIESVLKSGVYLGRKVYWKLYAVENLYRTIIHSILSIELSSDWWSIATPPLVQQKAERFRNNYLEKPWHTTPGKHLIYFTDLSGLNEIARTNSGSFEVEIQSIDEWVLKIEDLRLPRNVIAHMNFPNLADRRRIDAIYEEFKVIIKDIQDRGSILLKAPK